MLFHTWTFGLFYLITAAAYGLLRGTRAAQLLLLGASYLFYSWANPIHLLLLLYLTAATYLVTGFCLPRLQPGARTAAFALLVAHHAAIFIGIKYLPSGGGALATAWIFPAGFSFYTFQLLSYAIDVHRGTSPPERNFISFALYVAFFPQLIAGPVERASTLLPQIRSMPKPSLSGLAIGASWFLTGLFKKVALADPLGAFADPRFANPDAFGGIDLFFAAAAFSWQIYFDFSGYTDMARGGARALGFTLSRNFGHPYLAANFREFWRQWHLTLTGWFRDYIYIPLGGSRRAKWITARNITATMLLAGLWHGASLNFLIWSLIHAAGCILCHRPGMAAGSRWRPFAVAVTFLCLTVAWIFFRASTTAGAWSMLAGIVTRPGTAADLPLLLFMLVALVWAYQAALDSSLRPRVEGPFIQVPLATGMLLYLFLFPASTTPFIYFQF